MTKHTTPKRYINPKWAAAAGGVLAAVVLLVFFPHREETASVSVHAPAQVDYTDLVCDGRERDVYVPPNPHHRSRMIHSGDADIVPTLAPASGRYLACTEYDVCYGPDTPAEKMSPDPRWYFKTAHRGDGFHMGYHCQSKDG